MKMKVSIIISVLALCVFFFGTAVLLFRSSTNTNVWQMSGPSMSPTIEDGSMVISREESTYEQGDIIVYSSRNTELIHRVAATPGQEIEIKEDEMYVDGELFIVEGIENEVYAGTYPNEGETVTLAEDEYFVLGDNRNLSRDSRYSGPVMLEDIVGKVVNK